MNKTRRYHVIESDWGSGFKLSFASTSKDEAEAELEKRKQADLQRELRLTEKDFPEGPEERFDAVVQVLREKGVFIDDTGYSEDAFKLHIEWGDWKHDHWHADYIMKCFGFEFAGEEVTDSDMSDTYSAWRHYKPKA